MTEMSKPGLSNVDNLTELEAIEGGGFWSFVAGEAAGIATGVGVLLSLSNPVTAIALGITVGSVVMGATAIAE